MTKPACGKKKKALYVNHLSFLGVMWKHARQWEESQACCWYEKALTPDWAAVPLSICLSETERKREGWADWQMTKRMKERRVVCVVRRKRTERERRLVTNRLGGVRCLEATPKMEGWGGGGRKKDEAHPCCVSVSDSSLWLLCTPVSTAGQQLLVTHPFYSPTFLWHSSSLSPSYQQVDMQSSHISHPCPPPSSIPLSLIFSLSPSLSCSLGPFYFKASPLFAISEGN